jgi:hypothetical protein
MNDNELTAAALRWHAAHVRRLAVGRKSAASTPSCAPAATAGGAFSASSSRTTPAAS